MAHYKISAPWAALAFTILLPAGTLAAGTPMPAARTDSLEAVEIQFRHWLSDDDKAADDEVYDIDELDVKPQFPGGNAELLHFLNAQIHYPPICLESGVQGKVYAQFIVKKDGTIGNIGILRSPNPYLSREAVRVLNLMPKWIPGKKNGKAVATRFYVPVNFRIQEAAGKSK